MINSEVFIIKRDGKKETFSLDKIKNAIAKAFLSVGSFATQDVITTVLSRVSVSDGMNVEEIQKEFIKNNLDGKALLSILAEVLGEEEDGWKSDLSSMVEAVAKVRKNQ